MYLCLSSGSTPQYRQDIIRALAMPTGARLQFRYQDRWVSASVRNNVGAGDLQPDATIVAYIDQSDKTAIPRIVPCRIAKLVEPRTQGSTYTLKLELSSFCYAADLDRFNSEIRSAAAGQLPTYTDGHITGFYWLDVPRPTSIAESSELAEWEKIVKQLAVMPEVNTESMFFNVCGFRRVAGGEAVETRDGDFVVKPDTDYEMDFYHLHPTAFAAAELEVVTESKSVSITNPRMELASRYDVHEIRLHVADPSQSPGSDSHALLSVYRTQAGTRVWFFDIPLRIRRRIWRPIGIALLLGGALAASPVFAALTSDTLSDDRIAASIVVSVLAGIGAGVIAVFGIRKSI